MTVEDQDMNDMVDDMVDDIEDYQIKTKTYNPIVYKNSMHYRKVHNTGYYHDDHEINNNSTSLMSEAGLKVDVIIGLF